MTGTVMDSLRPLVLITRRRFLNCPIPRQTTEQFGLETVLNSTIPHMRHSAVKTADHFHMFASPRRRAASSIAPRGQRLRIGRDPTQQAQGKPYVMRSLGSASKSSSVTTATSSSGSANTCGAKTDGGHKEGCRFMPTRDHFLPLKSNAHRLSFSNPDATFMIVCQQVDCRSHSPLLSEAGAGHGKRGLNANSCKTDLIQAVLRSWHDRGRAVVQKLWASNIKLYIWNH